MLHDPNDTQQHRADAIMVGGFLILATASLFALKKLGFRAVIGVGS